MKEIRSNSIELWLGIFAFLCEIYHSIKVAGEPMKVVGTAILHNIESMLGNKDVVDDEFDCICTKLKVCGRLLEEQEPTRIGKILDTLRKHVISGKSSCQRRCYIMELIEFKQLGWTDAGGSLDKFYVDAIADAIAQDEVGEN